MIVSKPNPNALALAGEFATLSQLALRGYDASLTLGHTKHVDILVSDPRSGAMRKLEVKTSGHLNARGDAARRSGEFGYHYAWRMSKKHEGLTDPSLLYCFVNFAGLDRTSFRFFIVPSEVVAEYVKTQHQIWLDGGPDRKDSSMRVLRLALEPDGYPLPTPPAHQYENAWTLLEDPQP